MEMTRQSYSNQQREDVVKIGETLIEGVKDERQRNSVKEKYKDLVEKVEEYKQTEAFSDDADLYSTLQADMIEQALEPQLIGMDAIRSIDFQLGTGVDSINIPSGNQLTAVDVNSDGSLSEDTTDYDGKSISINWVGVRTTFSGQLVNKTAVDLLAYRMEQAGRAIARRVDSDILTEMENAGTKGDSTYGDNSNYIYTGDGNDVTFDDVIDVIETGLDNDAALDMGLLSTEVWAALHKDADMKNVLAFTATSDGDFGLVQNFGPLRLLASSQVNADKAIFVDSERTAMFVDASAVETFDGRVSENFQFEILAVKAYGVGILQPQSLVVLHQGAAEPA